MVLSNEYYLMSFEVLLSTSQYLPGIFRYRGYPNTIDCHMNFAGKSIKVELNQIILINQSMDPCHLKAY